MLKLIDGRGLTAKRVLQQESMQLQLSEKDSTASFTCGSGAGTLKTGEWIQDLEEPGKGIVWRIKSIDDQRDTGTRTVGLEHAINTLKDRILPAIKTKDISGSNSGASARAAINKILSYQEDWTLGTFDYDSVVLPYHFDGETLKAAIETVSSSLEDPVWEFNFATYPFKLNIKRLSATADSEMRGGRNLRTIRISEDRSQLYTRFFPVGKNNLRLSGGGYVSKNENKYGRIDKTETDQTKETEAELQAWANERLSRHARPGHTVSISGTELSESTGESLDRLRIGHKCRVPLPDDGDVITEKITKLVWRDKVKDRQDVTVTMADALEDVASIVKEEQQKSSGGARAAAKADEDNTLLIGSVERGLYTAIAQTATNILMHVHNVLEGYATIELTAQMISSSVSTAKSDMWTTIEQTAESIRLSVNRAKSDMWAEIQITSTSILSTVGNILEGYSTIEQTASSIRASVSSAKSDMYSEIKIQKDRIDLVVTGTGSNATVNVASIVLGINSSTGSSYAKIDAEHVYIGNTKSTTVIEGKLDVATVTGDWICSKISATNSLNVNSILANEIKVAVTGSSVSHVATQTYVSGCVYDLRITDNGSGTYTLQKKALGGSGSWVNVGSWVIP